MDLRNGNSPPAHGGYFQEIANRLFTPGGINPGTAVFTGCAAMLLVFFLDAITPHNFHVHILYSLPLALIAFHCERNYVALGSLALAIGLVLIAHFLQEFGTSFLLTDGMISLITMSLITWLSRMARTRSIQLLASEREARSILDNTQDTVARYDLECRRLYANPAFVAATEGGLKTLLGKKPSEFPGGEGAKIYEEKIRETIATGKTLRTELQWQGLGGQMNYSLVELTPEHDASGAIVSVLGIGRDISALKKTEQDLKDSMLLLEEKEAAKTRFLAAAGHDLRQPLAATSLLVDSLKLTRPTHAQTQIIQRLDKVMENFNDMVESLLNVSKLDAGVIHPELAWISIAEIFNWINESYSPQAANKNLRLRIHPLANRRLAVYCDIGQLKAILGNLVSNAIKFTEQGGILIGARMRNGNVLLQIWDTGIGIAPGEVGKIFDDFYQVSNKQRDRSKGLGLGLSIARRSMELFHGKIACRSRPGHGSVFEFSLPAGNILYSRWDEEETTELKEQEFIQSVIQGKRLLVLEDDPSVADALKKSLEMMGGEISCFDNAEAALQAPGSRDHDYFIVDYMLGGEADGIQFLNTLQKTARDPIRAVMISGDTSADFIRSAERFDWQVLHKPISLLKLARALNAH